MPQVPATNQTSEESRQQLESQESLHSSVLDKIKGGDVFKSLDLPSDEQQTQQRQRAPVEEQQQEEEQEQEEQQQEETQDDTDEEVIPKSKVQPRFDQMTAIIKSLKQQLAEKETATAPVDDIQRQLDSMTEDTLEESLIQTRIAREQSRDDPAKLAELVKLERRIEKTIATAPQKFVQNQVKEFNSAAQRLASEGELTNENYADILKIAKNEIYDRYPKLAKSVDGQAMALELAVAHYKQINKASSVKVDTNNLKGQLNNLKKKTSLDTKSVKGGSEKINLDRLRSNAMQGSMRDKERFAHNDPRFKIDAMIPDYLKG